jgi:nucleotide-binding universal stress UspA family protein
MSIFIIAIDFTSDVDPLLQVGIEIAKRFEGKLRLVHVIESFPATNENWLPEQDYASAMSTMKRDLIARLESLASYIKSQGIPCDVRLLSGSPDTALCDAVTETSATYLIMGHRGHGAFHDLFGFSVSQAALKKVHVPMLLVPLEQSDACSSTPHPGFSCAR